MKVAVQCLGCGKLIRYYGSFSVRLKERTKVLLTGEVKEQDVVGKICRECAIKAGYKVKDLSS